ncbi:hypothetical protein SUV52_11060 [Streptococcus agalactiae]
MIPKFRVFNKKLKKCIALMAISILNVALQDHYKSQITELRTQLSRTQKQLKRASDDRARQTKRIAELTGNGG